MYRVLLKDINERIEKKERPAEYLQVCRDMADREDKEALYFTKENYDSLRTHFAARRSTPSRKRKAVHTFAAPFTTPVKPSRPKRKGPGDHLKQIIEARFGTLPDQEASCGCQEMLDKMNGWGVEGCRRRRAEIVAHLMGNVEQLPKAMQYALKLPGGQWLAEREAGRMVDEAVARAEGATN